MKEKVPLGKGHVVKEVKIGNSVCRICDDYCVGTNEEVQKILRNVGIIAARGYARKKASA